MMRVEARSVSNGRLRAASVVAFSFMREQMQTLGSLAWLIQRSPRLSSEYVEKWQW